MERSRTSTRTYADRRTHTYGRTEYIHGNAVRRLDVQRELQEPPRKKVSHTTRKNRERAFHMNFPYVLFLASALIIMGITLVGYIQIQAEITNTVEHISQMESQLNDLKLANDEAYSRITSSIDIEEIKRIAIGELGMHYAEEGQIISYSVDGSDYVRQFSDIPQ